MAVWSKINFKNIEYSRIDAEFYQPKYVDELKLWSSLAKIHTVAKLKHIISKPVRTGHTPKNRLIKKEDSLVPFIKTNTLREGKIVYSKVEFLPKRCLGNNDYIEDNASIVTIIGATKEIVGRVAIKELKDPASTTNQNVAIINFKPEIDPYYAMIYLQSKYGRDQLWRHSRQTEQVNLNCREVERVLFPIIDKDLQIEIGNLVRNSFKLDETSLILFKQANDLIEQEVGLDKITFENSKSYVANFSEVIKNNRSDADFYQTKFKQLAKHIDTLDTVYLGSICSSLKGFEVGTPAYTDFGPTFIRVSNLTKDGFSFGNSDKYISEETFKNLKKYQPKIGDILLTKDGTIGTCNVVDEDVQGIISSGIMNLTLNDTNIPKEYLALVINSQICQMQADRDCSGALITHWKPEQIRKLKIPILEKETMIKLAELVSNSKIARKQSKDLLTQAKNRVEQLIEEASTKN